MLKRVSHPHIIKLEEVLDTPKVRKNLRDRLTKVDTLLLSKYVYSLHSVMGMHACMFILIVVLLANLFTVPCTHKCRRCTHIHTIQMHTYIFTLKIKTNLLFVYIV